MSQLLANIPAAIVPSPIHKNGNMPVRNSPTTCWFDNASINPIPDDISELSIVVIPAGTEASIRIKPVTNVNILMNPVGVGFA